MSLVDGLVPRCDDGRMMNDDSQPSLSDLCTNSGEMISDLYGYIDETALRIIRDTREALAHEEADTLFFSNTRVARAISADQTEAASFVSFEHGECDPELVFLLLEFALCQMLGTTPDQISADY